MNWNPTWICPANDLGDPAAVFGTSFVFEKKNYTCKFDNNCHGRV